MKISINLLPLEFTLEQHKKTKFYKIQAAGVAIIMAMVFLTVVTLGLRFLQSGNIAEVQDNLSRIENKVSELKTTQASLLLLKNRLTTINQYLGTSSKQAEMYKLINKLIPPSVTVSSFNIDKSGQVVLLALIPDPVALDNLVESLTSSELNEGKINQVSIDSLNRAREGIYRISMKVQAK